ncbi:TPA: hypothetical protein HA235_00125 [Candidatus Woesearchaeota archaeon]|nr:hypothetical protein [Candidatus Woesearchaeota archaeon]HIH31091.1 hypothetical protein [Candidatus Woesearchaeota archaeon]HIH55599.1 hypothetical protein [Candidatus Woesearchaeota archaeon]HIJ01211.1 hypothetical protein [Candidatus Woesearchaeota archaeon]HIJ14493.1 hypothetical protein [Candidatus Woesearchaeota archaeon]
MVWKSKNVRIIFKDDAKISYKRLNAIVKDQKSKNTNKSFEISLLNSIEQKISILKTNPFYGDNISKKIIPEKYDVSNLWRMEITGYWRMLYAIEGTDIEIICFILDILDHDSYNKIFRYRKR